MKKDEEKSNREVKEKVWHLHLLNILKEADEAKEKFQARVAQDPVDAVRWSTDMIIDIEMGIEAEMILRLEEKGEETFGAIVDRRVALMTTALLENRYSSYSTSPMANAVSEAKREAFSRLVRMLR
jgi:hypothetical protein